MQLKDSRATTPRRSRHVNRSLPRRVAGWFMLSLALLGFVLPVLPGLVFLAFGILLLGPHDPLLRWLALLTRTLLRRWCHLRQPHLRWLGRWARQHYVETRRLLRAQLHQHSNGAHGWRTHGLLLAGVLISLGVMAGGSLLVWHMVP